MVAGLLEYAVHALAYSLLAWVVVELLLIVWRVQDPPLGIATRLLVLAAPPIAPLLFGLPGIGWGSDEFRHRVALLDLDNWLGPEPALLHPIWLFLLVIMFATTALEAVAFFRWLRSGRSREPRLLPDSSDRLRAANAALGARGIAVPTIRVVEHPGPTAYTVGLLKQRILISPSLVEMLDDEELEGVLAHECAHVARHDNWLGWLMFALRVGSFYNPYAQLTFHRIGQDIEKVCDGEAGAATGKPLALASALIKVYLNTRASPGRHASPAAQLSTKAVALENRARRTLVEDRVERLVHPGASLPTSYPQLRLALAAATVVGLSYFIL